MVFDTFFSRLGKEPSRTQPFFLSGRNIGQYQVRLADLYAFADEVSNILVNDSIPEYASCGVVPTPSVGYVNMFRLISDGLVYIKDANGVCTVIGASSTLAQVLAAGRAVDATGTINDFTAIKALDVNLRALYDGSAGISFNFNTRVFTSANGTVIGSWTNSGFQFGTSANFGGGVNVVSLQNATTVPTTNPATGLVTYSEGGQLKYRDSSGNIITL